MKTQETITKLDTLSTALNWYEEAQLYIPDKEKLTRQIEEARDLVAGIYEFEKMTGCLCIGPDQHEAFAYGMYHDLKVLSRLVSDWLEGYRMAECNTTRMLTVSALSQHFKEFMASRGYLNAGVVK